MKNLIMHRKGEASFVSYIKKRLRQNLNFLCLFSGPTGIGKTYNGLSLAYQLDPAFDPETQITFDFQQTMKLINDPVFHKKKVKIILWDEPQISISNRAWQSEINRLVNYLLSTFRHQNVILIWCAPYKDFLDAQSMKLLHCNFKCVGVDRKTNLSRVLPRLLQYNADLKKVYQHSLYVIHNGRTSKMNHWDIAKPPKHLIDVYERRKTEFTSALNQEIEAKLNKHEPKEKAEFVIDPRRSLTRQQAEVMMLLGKGMTGLQVAKQLGITNEAVTDRKRRAEKKGYKVLEFANSPTGGQLRAFRPESDEKLAQGGHNVNLEKVDSGK